MLNKVSMSTALKSASSPTLTPRIIPGLTRPGMRGEGCIRRRYGCFTQARGNFTPRARREVAQVPWTDPEANQAKRGQSDCGGHEPHLAIAPLTQRDLDPRGRYRP